MSSVPATPLKLGTRRSPLAMVQAEEARRLLCAAQGWPLDAVTLVPVTASGDKVQDRPLAEIGGKALWTKELDAWLIAGEIDFAVHSAKDVETMRPAAITIAAVLEREDVCDVLVGAPSLAALPPGAVIGTSAPRRAAQLLHMRPDCRVVSFRGNVATRLAKLAAGEADATLLAAAGLKRLGQMAVGTPLNVSDWLPAPGQGAIAIECRSDDVETRALLAAIDHAPSRATLLAERGLLAALGGNCHSAIGVVTESNGVGEGEQLHMRAALFGPDGVERIEAETRFAPGDTAAPVWLAADLLAHASPQLRALFGGA